MWLTPGTRRLLDNVPVGVLALWAGRLPLATMAAFHFDGTSLWMTTARHAAKLVIARRNPNAAFLVWAVGQAVLLQGRLEAYDGLSLSGPLRALLDAPAFLGGVASYAMKSTPFVGGYLRDLRSVPLGWWPQNRVVLRLRVGGGRLLAVPEPAPALPVHLPSTPAHVTEAVSRVGTGVLCWPSRPAPAPPELAPVRWAATGTSVQAWLPAWQAPGDREKTPAALLVTRRDSVLRPTSTLGVCLRGQAAIDPAAVSAVGERCQVTLRGGVGLHVEVERHNWWSGFDVGRDARRPDPRPRVTILPSQP